MVNVFVKKTKNVDYLRGNEKATRNVAWTVETFPVILTGNNRLLFST